MTDKKDVALKLALEALEGCLPYIQEQRGDMKTYNTELAADNAITAIREALVEQPQGVKFNEGLWQEREARIAQLEAELMRMQGRELKLQFALAERCVCGAPDTPGTHRTDGPCLAEQSAEIPQSITCPFCESQHVPGWLHDYNMDHIKKPAQQEPVARLHITETDTYPDVEVEVLDGTTLQPSMSPVNVYTSPPSLSLAQRKPLTDQEIKELYGDDDNFRMTKKYVVAFARAIEAKLREKNA